MIRKSITITAGVFLTWLGSWNSAAGQQAVTPLSDVVLAGYGSATYGAGTSSDFVNNFAASVSPVLLYSMGEDLLFETELEFGLSGENTTTSLEYAQVDYLGFEKVQVIGGKFLLPFGLFSERLHPTWINKMPSSPLVYGHAHNGVAEGTLLPILADAGLLLRYRENLSSTLDLNISAWVSQGPQMTTADNHVDEDEPHLHKTLDEGHGEVIIPLVGFGIGFADNNKNKMLGARIGLVNGASFETYVSGFVARYDVENYLDLNGVNVSTDIRRAGFDVRFEGIVLWQEIPLDDRFETFSKSGFYLQLARQLGAFEPVVRWSHLLESTIEGAIAQDERRQLALGVNYWISASVPVKLAYEIEFDGQDRILVQWAFGF